jgi:hypothetical protein
LKIQGYTEEYWLRMGPLVENIGNVE